MVLTCTVLPSPTMISCKTPEAGAGISASTLSVEISNRGSSRWTLSPGFLSHFVIVPSKMDSPIWGMMTSVGIMSFHGALGNEYRAKHKSLLYIERVGDASEQGRNSHRSIAPAVAVGFSDARGLRAPRVRHRRRVGQRLP